MSTRPPPDTVPGILKELGPGLIIAGSIVGSGELIATTLTGAKAGFCLMWIIIVGCLIKVFAQLEIGKFTISTGRTTLQGLSMLPGFKACGIHWIVWLWLITFIASLGQAGGIVGAIGQSFSIGAPLTEQGRIYNEAADLMVSQQISLNTRNAAESGIESIDSLIHSLPSSGPDVLYWSLIISLLTSFILFRGGFSLFERIVVGLVASFTLLSVVNFVLLQMNEAWAVSLSDIWTGLSFRLPPGEQGNDSLIIALATFGLIGMSGGELIYYPYWCLEKGYAKFIGPRDDSPEWADRAKGWTRVMRWDAWASMVVYTLSTIVFYLMGASVLNRAGMIPKGTELIRTLAAMYEPAFGTWAVGLFLVGAVIVLYSTFLVGSGSNALVFSDVMEIFSKHRNSGLRRETVRPFIGLSLPIIAFLMLLAFPEPTTLILLAGATQTLLLPILAFSAVYFRFRLTDCTLHSGKLWDVCLILSSITLFIVGMWLISTALIPRVLELF